ncbi:NUDIX domain-containing protein [Paenibacillus rhizovicinus]|uniref:NUDIX domain-containing protein n=1 Tax=Paenibacillus rhizovicinus TaxID=2704463 RepID=A0A6C0NZD0_9BACL|nr:NUDIX domain-containing protein [Paenibacillus rhizovicinus]QHW31595.1 NUDIX domain-containing protein [Paenibacillus rhizovicinus]
MSGHSQAGGGEEERFDYYDEHGVWLGTAPRSEVHARGLWHRSIHCWLARREGDRRLVLFQQRAPGKDTFPGSFDITAAGHLAAGETMRDAAREIEEELGAAIPFESLLSLGEARKESAGVAKGLAFLDREISGVYGYVYPGPLSSLTLQQDEVSGVYEAELEAMIALFDGRRQHARAAGFRLDNEGRAVDAEAEVKASDFVPRPASYYRDVFQALLHLL